MEQLFKLDVSQVFNTFHNVLHAQPVCSDCVTSLKVKEGEAAVKKMYELLLSTQCPCTSAGSNTGPKYSIMCYSIKQYYGPKEAKQLSMLSCCL